MKKNLTMDKMNPIQIKAYYGDALKSRTVVIDVNNMTLSTTIDTKGKGHYSVNQAGTLKKVYVDTRKSNFLEVINAQTNKQEGFIKLKHNPRSSEAYNTSLGLQLVSGRDKVMISLIDVKTDTVVASVGEEILDPSNQDYGGSNATGHPFWFSNSEFALIDRPNRKIHVYTVSQNQSKWNVALAYTISTPTAVHHFIRTTDDNVFYAIAEGAKGKNLAPIVIKYERTICNTYNEVKCVPLSKGINIDNLGSHHINMHPDGNHIYIGSTEGNLYVLDTRKMEILGTIAVGKGAGHSTFVPERNLAIVTNHKDTFISIIDTEKHTLIKNVKVSEAQKNGTILQSHTSFVNPEFSHFYAYATDNGIFYEFDLETLEVSRTLHTGGTPLQGVFLCDDLRCPNADAMDMM